MDVTADLSNSYLEIAFDQMLGVFDRLGDDLVSVRPGDQSTNSVAGLVAHCCGVAEFWLGHVALGRDSHRDRDAEFSTTATVAELRAMVAATRAQVARDLADIDAGRSVPGSPDRARIAADGSDASIVLHMLEELFQHLGHMDVTADVVLARQG